MARIDDKERERIAQEADRLNLRETAKAWRDSKIGQARKSFDPATDVTLECPYCRAYKIVPRTPELPSEVRLIEIVCPNCDDGDFHAETWFSAPGVEVSQNRQATILCDDCPPVDYPTDKTRCLPCPRRTI